MTILLLLFWKAQKEPAVIYSNRIHRNPDNSWQGQSIASSQTEAGTVPWADNFTIFDISVPQCFSIMRAPEFIISPKNPHFQA
jgi:hypothetical protein